MSCSPVKPRAAVATPNKKGTRNSEFDVRSTVIAYLEVKGLCPFFQILRTTCSDFGYVGCLACREQSEV